MALLKYNGKIVLFNGAFTSAQDFTVIELEVSGSTFVDRSNAFFQIQSSTPNNTIYIDFQDGTGEHAFAPNSGNNHVYIGTNSNTIYTYQDGNTGRRKVFIRFKNSQDVTYIQLANFMMYGNFPKSIANYNLTEGLSFSNNTTSKWDAFPVDFRSVNSMSVMFRNTFQNKVVNLSPWVYSSRIQTLILDGIFNLSALPAINHTDKLINIVGLKNLTLANSDLNSNSLPSNLKDISTLEYLRIGNNSTLTTLPTVLVGCANIKTLILGSGDGFGYSHITSWGNGITGMIRLETLTCMGGVATNSPTSIPTGLNTCVALKNIDLRGGYRTQARIDEFVTNFYNYVVANPNLTNINLNIGYSGSTVLNTRPSGVYQTSSTPTTPMEMIYKLVNDYRHTVTVTNITNNGNEVLTP